MNDKCHALADRSVRQPDNRYAQFSVDFRYAQFSVDFLDRGDEPTAEGGFDLADCGQPG